MNIIFLTLLDVSNINERSIYHDLLRKFRNEGHQVYVVYPSERRKNRRSGIRVQDGVTLLNVRTLNIQKTNVFEKGIGSLLLEYQFLTAIHKYLGNITFDLVLYSTPPITLGKVIQFIKKKNGALSYLLLKDIFPQNAVDLGMLKSGGLIHRYFSRKEKQLYFLSDYIGCMSPANVHYLLSHNKEVSSDRVEVNPNSITPKPYEFSLNDRIRIRNKFHIPQDSLVFIYGGNLGKPQGIDFLIDVLTSNINNSKIFFVVVGDGTEYRKLNKWHNKSQPQNCIVIPSLSKSEYDDLIRACDIGLIFLDKRFTIPNFPSRLLSYLESKLPVIAATDKNTDIGRILEEAGAGFWLESGDLKRFNDCINIMSSNKAIVQRMSICAYTLLEQNYTVDVSFDKIIGKLNPDTKNHK